MVRHQVKQISSTVPTSLDIAETIRSSYTLVVQHIGSSGYIYIGNENVSISNFGYKLYPGQGMTIELPSRIIIYAIASTTNLPVSIMEIDRAI